MDTSLAAINEFLHEILMHPELTDLPEMTAACISEMERGLKGEESSVKMIPTFVSAHGRPQNGAPVIAVDAGGTNLRVALVRFTDDRPEISQLQVYPIPGSQGEISSDEFFDALAERILPLTETSDCIGFCFSYPAEIFPDRDGKILRLSKGVNVRGAEGLVLGRELKEKLRQKGVSQEMRFTLLNDTVASLMGGAAQFPMEGFDGMCGLILGTGFNTCYPEKGERISKLPGAKDMIINCETSNFSKLFRGLSDEMTDADSLNPGIGHCEKMISGAYHGIVMTNTMILAGKKGLLSPGFAALSEPFTAPELDGFMRGAENRVSRLCEGDDAPVVRAIIDQSFERAAKVVCAIVAAHCLICDGGKTTERPFCVIAEGSTFYKSLLLRDKLSRYVEEYITGTLSRHVVFHGAENLTLTGAALSALING